MKKTILVFIISLFFMQIKAQQSITGKVTDENNTPLPGVTIQVKNTFRGAITDMNGSFIISAT
ncbi:MAG TPA: carboxypeptidase-like regulatory domain-containing protein, partial [Bacteroidales bacterium]|nr:carboxypeptidase-like regulatory domain-containing protein [Bacteroidales bacterium]